MLLNCVAYQEGKKLADIDVEAISDHVERPECFVWVALRDPEDAELQKMQEEFGLHDLAVEDARHGRQRPKVEEYGDTVFAVIHILEMGADGEIEAGELHVFVGVNFVLSVRTGSKRSFLGVRERAEREPHLLRHGAGFVFYALLDAVVDHYFPIIEAMEDELETIENDIFEGRAGRAIVERLYALKRRVMVVRHAVAPMLESSSKLTGGRVPRVCEDSRDYFRDVHDHLARILSGLDNLRETIATAIQVNLSLVAVEDSETSKRLAAWAGVFGLATVFVGIWGMNFEFMPELKWKYGYPAALGLVAASCTLLYLRFKRAGWL